MRDSPMKESDAVDTPFSILVVAASAGGLKALKSLLSALPGDFRLPIAVVQHLDPRNTSLIADILDRNSALRVKDVEDEESLQKGTVYFAKPDYHMLVNRDGTVSLTKTELVHFVRPSADLLFESAAASYREGTIAVVLTGTGSDGSLGVKAVDMTGGTVIVQEAETSEFEGMPLAAIATGAVDFILPLEEIPAAILKLVEERDR